MRKNKCKISTKMKSISKLVLNNRKSEETECETTTKSKSARVFLIKQSSLSEQKALRSKQP